MKVATLACLLGAAVMLPFTTPAALNLVNDGGFEQQTASEPFQTFNAFSTMGGWSVTAGSVDLIRSYWQPAEGSQSVDMAGFFQSGTIEQTINGTTAGAWYHLTFNMSGNPDGPPAIKTLSVTFGNTTTQFTFDASNISRTDMGWQVRSGNFQATGPSTVLSFTDTSGAPNAYGAVIDNVSLVAVPETNTFIAGTLLLLPFAASTLRILGKKRAA